MGSSNKLVVVNYIDIQQISCSAQTGAAFALAGLMLSFLGTATTMYMYVYVCICVYVLCIVYMCVCIVYCVYMHVYVCVCVCVHG